jgi:hypothetical protein
LAGALAIDSTDGMGEAAGEPTFWTSRVAATAITVLKTIPSSSVVSDNSKVRLPGGLLTVALLAVVAVLTAIGENAASKDNGDD